MDTTTWAALHTVFEVANRDVLERVRNAEHFLPAFERATPLHLRYLSACLSDLQKRRANKTNPSLVWVCSLRNVSYVYDIPQTLDDVQTLAELIVGKGYWVKTYPTDENHLFIAWALPTDLKGYMNPKRLVEPLSVQGIVREVQHGCGYACGHEDEEEDEDEDEDEKEDEDEPDANCRSKLPAHRFGVKPMDTTMWAALHTVLEVTNRDVLERVRNVEHLLPAFDRATPVDLWYLSACLSDLQNRTCMPVAQQSWTCCLSGLSFTYDILHTLDCVQTLAELIVAKGYWVKPDPTVGHYLHIAWTLPTDLEGFIIPRRVDVTRETDIARRNQEDRQRQTETDPRQT
jgi:hypothetical protein